MGVQTPQDRAKEKQGSCSEASVPDARSSVIWLQGSYLTFLGLSSLYGHGYIQALFFRLGKALEDRLYKCLSDKVQGLCVLAGWPRMLCQLICISVSLL